MSVMLFSVQAWAQESNQFYLAAQYDWGTCRGFIFMVEGKPQGGNAATLADAKLTLGVGDGHAWHFISSDSNWKKGNTYNVSATIGGGVAHLEIDGKSVGQMHCGFVPNSGDLLYGQASNIMRGPADYLVQQGALHLRSGASVVDLRSAASQVPPQLLMLNPAAGRDEAHFSTVKSIAIQTSFHFGPKANLRELSPFIDQYGQSIQANWPGKVKSDDDLKSAQRLEAQRLAEWKMPKGFDQYGGVENASWKQSATGFFKVTKHDGKWWLIAPTGNPCFYVGICSTPALKSGTPVTGREYVFAWLAPHDGTFAQAWSSNTWHTPGDADTDYFAFDTANFIRKYGQDWSNQVSESAVRRTRALGFSGFGKWSAGELGVCYLPVLWNRGPDLVKHPDVFDPAVRKQIVSDLRRDIEPRKNDPWVVGWSVGNEKEEDISPDEVRAILKMPNSVPARQAFLAFDKNATPESNDDEIETLREYYENAYFKFLYATVKSIDPNHLYFGNWVTPNWWENEADWKIDAANCDVIGFDWYSLRFGNDPIGKLLASNDKPALCGEFSFPPTYNGQRGFGTYGTHSSDDAEAGRLYDRWLHDAAENPNCVGVLYFEYSDEPLTGRGPGDSRNALVVGEDYAFGLVDVTDRIKWDFAERVRQANLQAAQWRLR
ncbi:MAG TPA: hypothetical protein VG722_08880 [Tepidisphaeraceae bacterium]|nr:hypothetical protein [Tepidisphaeraceae bacterium]